MCVKAPIEIKRTCLHYSRRTCEQFRTRRVSRIISVAIFIATIFFFLSFSLSLFPVRVKFRSLLSSIYTTMQITTTDGRGVYLIFSDSDFVAYVLISYRSIDRSVRRHLYDSTEKMGWNSTGGTKRHFIINIPVNIFYVILNYYTTF